MKSSDFRDLIVWQKAMQLTANVYQLTKFLPKEETYGLRDQMRRAVVSIPSNIAEGAGRNSDKDLVRFLAMARGSLWELSTQLEICELLNYLDVSRTESSRLLITEISKMLNSLSHSLNQNN